MFEIVIIKKSYDFFKIWVKIPSKILRPKMAHTKINQRGSYDISIESPWRAESKNIFTKNSGQLWPSYGGLKFGEWYHTRKRCVLVPKTPKTPRGNLPSQCNTHQTVNHPTVPSAAEGTTTVLNPSDRLITGICRVLFAKIVLFLLTLTPAIFHPFFSLMLDFKNLAFSKFMYFIFCINF